MSRRDDIQGVDGDNQGGDNSHWHGYGGDEGCHYHQVSDDTWSRDSFDGDGNYTGTEVDHQGGE